MTHYPTGHRKKRSLKDDLNCILLHLTWDVNKHYKHSFFLIQFVHPFTENTEERNFFFFFFAKYTCWKKRSGFHKLCQLKAVPSCIGEKGTIDRVHSSVCSPECLEFYWSSLLVDPMLQVWSPWVTSWVQRSPSYSPVCFWCSVGEAMHVQRSLKCKMTKHFKLPDVSLRVEDF